MSAGTRKTGEFCWFNMLTPQPDEARAFFSTLLGWTYVGMRGMAGHTAQAGGRNIGALFDLADPKTPIGTPPMIGVVVKVASADAVGQKAKALGGTAHPAFDLGDNLRLAVCADPNGAMFDVWEPKKAHGTDADTRERGAPSWFETITTDVERAAAFYSELFGWTPESGPMPGSSYTTFKHGTEYVAGMMPITPQMGNQRPHWKTYFTVPDAEATAREAVGLGGSLCVRLHDVPGVGRFCGITSPQGIAFYVTQYTN